MNGYEYIVEKQISWAKRKNINLVGSQKTKGRKTYTNVLNDNLFMPLSAKVLKEIRAGDGGELTDTANKKAKMCALHSSSALGINVFQYWLNKNINDITYCLGLCRKGSNKSEKIIFEKKCKISEKFNFDPNLDVFIKNIDGEKIKAYGIECKFSEAYGARKHPGLKPQYLKEDIWEGLYNIRKLAEQLSPNDNQYKHLHPAQLIKHILGLRKDENNNPRDFRLLYLWYDVPGFDGERHRREIEEFSKYVKADKIKFHSISYQELIIKLNKEFYGEHEDYVIYLSDRYL